MATYGSPVVGKFAGYLDLLIPTGEPFVKEFIWWDTFYAEGDVRNVAKDLTGYSAYFTIKLRKALATSVIAASDADYITIDGPNGSVRVELPQVLVDTFTWRVKAFWDLVLVDPLAVPTRLVEGRVKLDRGVFGS